MPVFGRSRVPLLPTNRRPTRRCLSGILFEEIVWNAWVSPSNEPCRKSRPRSIRPSRADSQNSRQTISAGDRIHMSQKPKSLLFTGLISRNSWRSKLCPPLTHPLDVTTRLNNSKQSFAVYGARLDRHFWRERRFRDGAISSRCLAECDRDPRAEVSIARRR